MNPRRGFWRTFLSVLAASVLIVIIGLAVLLQVVPRLMGGTSLTVLSGSMEPVFSPGDVIAVRAVDPDDIRVGDIITFQPVSNDPALVTHRVVGVGFNTLDGVVLTTRGDANTTTDDPIVGAQVRGLYLYHVPYLGLILQPLGANAPLLAAILGVGLLGYAGYALFRPRGRGGTHSRAAASVIVVIAVVAASAIGGGATQASAATPTPEPTADADLSEVTFVGPTRHVDWNGGFVTTSESSFFGDRMVTPGDRVARSVDVANTGPTDGLLTVKLVDVELSGTRDLNDRISLAWTMVDASGTNVFAEIYEGDSTIADGIALDQGQSRVFTLLLTYPPDSTAGGQADAGVTIIDFDIEFIVLERIPPDEPGGLAVTGGVIALGTLAAALILLSAGIALVLVRRRRVRA